MEGDEGEPNDKYDEDNPTRGGVDGGGGTPVASKYVEDTTRGECAKTTLTLDSGDPDTTECTGN